MALGTTGLVALAAITAGVVGAGAALCLAPAPAETSAPASTDGARIAALESTLAKQEEKIRILEGRIQEAAARPAVVAAPAAGKSGDAAADPISHEYHGDAMVTEGTGPEAALDPASPVAQARFEEMYRTMRTREQEEARKSRLVAYETQLRERLDRAAALNLTPDQKEQVMKLLLGRAEKIRGIQDEARTAGSPEGYQAAQQQMAAARQETRQALEALLTPEQMKVLDAVDREGGANRPGGRIPGPNGGRRNGAGRDGAAPGGGAEAPR